MFCRALAKLSQHGQPDLADVELYQFDARWETLGSDQICFHQSISIVGCAWTPSMFCTAVYLFALPFLQDDVVDGTTECEEMPCRQHQSR